MARTPRKAGQGVAVFVTGVKQVDRRLRALPKTIRRKVLNKAVRAGLKPVHDEARALCPEDTGDLGTSIKVRAWPKRRRNQVAMEVITGEGTFRGETFYGGMVEYGHFAGHRRLGNTRAWVEARPFMRPAYDRKRAEARAAATARIRAGIETSARVLARGGKVSARDL